MYGEIRKDIFRCIFIKEMKIKVPDDMEVELEPSVYTRPEHAEEYRLYEQLNGN